MNLRSTILSVKTADDKARVKSPARESQKKGNTNMFVKLIIRVTEDGDILNEFVLEDPDMAALEELKRKVEEKLDEFDTSAEDFEYPDIHDYIRKNFKVVEMPEITIMY